MEGNRVVPARSKVNYPITMIRVELGQLFGEGLNWWEHELQRYFDDRGIVLIASWPPKLFDSIAFLFLFHNKSHYR